jgi:hypothetical protein
MEAMGINTIILRLGIAFTILLILSVPWILGIKKKWDFIERALAGVDGVTDVHELRIGVSYLILICFIIIYFFMIITAGALGWQYPDFIYTYTFIGTLGAEASVLVSLINNFKKPRL